MSLNDKQTRFVAEFLIDLNATQAALRAGYSPKTAEVQGCQLLKNPKITKLVAELKAKQLQKLNITAERVLDEISKLSFSNVKRLFDESGNLRPVHLLTDDEAACISSLEVIKKNAEAGDGKIDTVHKLKVWDKTRSLEMLAKHFALLTEQVRHSGEVTYRWQD